MQLSVLDNYSKNGDRMLYMQEDLLVLYQLSSIEYLANSTLLTLRHSLLRTLTMMEVDQVSCVDEIMYNIDDNTEKA